MRDLGDRDLGAQYVGLAHFAFLGSSSASGHRFAQSVRAKLAFSKANAQADAKARPARKQSSRTPSPSSLFPGGHVARVPRPFSSFSSSLSFRVPPLGRFRKKASQDIAPGNSPRPFSPGRCRPLPGPIPDHFLGHACALFSHVPGAFSRAGAAGQPAQKSPKRAALFDQWIRKPPRLRAAIWGYNCRRIERI
jgi:hypothetical protein